MYLENDFWECIEQIATQRGITIDRLVAQVVGDASKDELSAMLRVFVLSYYRQCLGELSSCELDVLAFEESLLDDKPRKPQIH